MYARAWFQRVQRICLVIFISLDLHASDARHVVRFLDGQRVAIHGREFPLNGFRFLGNPTQPASLTLHTGTAMHVLSMQEHAVTAQDSTHHHWFGIFACANDGDTTPTFRLVPFLRLDTTTNGDTFTLMHSGEFAPCTPRTPSCSWRTLPSLTDVLVVTETLEGRPSCFSGRVTRIRNATADSCTLVDPGTVGHGDFLLPAPPGFRHYGYLGCFYYAAGEVRPLADTGTLVKARMADLARLYPLSRKVSGKAIGVAGAVSPLATAVLVDATTDLNTHATGDCAEYFTPEPQGQPLATLLHRKTSTSLGDGFSTPGLVLPFMFSQTLYLTTAGALANHREPVVYQVAGWIEP